MKLKRSGQTKQIEIPARIGLRFADGVLEFADDASLFWVEIRPFLEGQIEGTVFAAEAGGKTRDEMKDEMKERAAQVASFLAYPEASSFQSAHDFAEGSPFRQLAEAKWRGKDLLKKELGIAPFAERLEIGDLAAHGYQLEVEEGSWLVWKEGRWSPQKEESAASSSNRAEGVIARVHSDGGGNLQIEGWEGERFVRFSLSPATSPLKIKGEDLFSAIRIRSERQISCMLEKQCLILKAGDWAAKKGGRWKVLRNEMERRAFLEEDLTGELFIFDQIGQKQGQKTLQGKFYASFRSQAIAIELAAKPPYKTLRGAGIGSGVGKEPASEEMRGLKQGRMR